MREIGWHLHEGIEIRLSSSKSTARYGIGREPRSGAGPLFHADYDSGHAGVNLPATLLLCVDHAGQEIDLTPIVNEIAPGAARRTATVVLPVSHPAILSNATPGQAERLPAIWLQGIEEIQTDEISRRGGILPGIKLQQDESVQSLGHGFPRPLWLQRLPRIVLRPDAEIADNTEASLTMGHLLEQFVHLCVRMPADDIRKDPRDSYAVPEVRSPEHYAVERVFHAQPSLSEGPWGIDAYSEELNASRKRIHFSPQQLDGYLPLVQGKQFNLFGVHFGDLADSWVDPASSEIGDFLRGKQEGRILDAIAEYLERTGRRPPRRHFHPSRYRK